MGQFVPVTRNVYDTQLSGVFDFCWSSVFIWPLRGVTGLIRLYMEFLLALSYLGIYTGSFDRQLVFVTSSLVFDL